MKATVAYAVNHFDPTQSVTRTITRKTRIQTLAPNIHIPVIAILNGEPVLRKNKGWHKCVKDGDSLVFVARQLGGGGGSNPLRVVLMIGLSLAAPGIGNALAGSLGLGTASVFGISVGSLIGGAVSLVGSMVINALVPNATPKQVRQTNISNTETPTYSLTPQGNSARLLEPVPVQYGRHMFYPDYAAQPYTEYAGNEQYLYQLFCLGQGEFDIHNIYIEDTDINNFPEVNTEIVLPNTKVGLFPANVVTASEVSGQELLTTGYIGGFIVNSPGTRANFLAFDMVYPRGLFFANDAGGLNPLSVRYQFDARTVNDMGVATGGWFVLAQYTEPNMASSTAQRRTHRYPVPEGRYEVRAIRLDTKNTSSRAGHEVLWASAKAYLPAADTYGNKTMLAIRMRATNSLSAQASRRVRVLATRKLPVWDSGENLLSHSNDLTQTSVWAPINARVFNDATVDANGGKNAFKLVANTANAAHFIDQYPAVAAGKDMMFVWDFKPAEYQNVQLIVYSNPTFSTINASVNFNLITRTFSGAVNNNAVSNYGFVALNNGWVRVWLQFRLVTIETLLFARLIILNNAGLQTFAGNNINGIYVARPQLNYGKKLIDYAASNTVFFSRATEASYRDKDGIIKFAAANVPRTHYFVNNQIPNTNLLQWGIDQVSIEPALGLHPITKQAIVKFIPNQANNQHYIFQNYGFANIGETVTFSISIKPENLTTAMLLMFGEPLVNFDLLNGKVLSGTGSINYEGDGWYRCSITVTRTNTTALVYVVASQNGSNFFASNNLDALYLSSPQFEFGAALSAYTHEPQGQLLAEVSSTNLLRYSEQFDNAAWVKLNGATVTANNAISPDGTQNADTFNIAASQSQSIYQDFTAAGTSTVCGSIYVKSSNVNNISLGIFWFIGGITQSVFIGINPITGAFISNNATGATLLGFDIVKEKNGWLRIWVAGQGTDAANTQVRFQLYENPTTAGSLLVWGAQAELNFRPSSYIRTFVTAVTRATDIVAANTKTEGWSNPVPTRNPAWAMADMLKANYGGKQTDKRISLTKLKQLADTYTARNDTFDVRFESHTTIYEALTVAGLCARTKPYLQGGVWKFWRDEPQQLPVAMFNDRNIMQGTFKTQYLTPTEDTADSVIVEYFDETIWNWETVTCNLPDASQERPAKIRLMGVINRQQAYREGMYTAATNRYRRNLTSFQTEMEGFIPAFGSLVAVQNDRPKWGRSGDVVAKKHANIMPFSEYDPAIWQGILDTPTITTGIADPLGGTNAVRIAKSAGNAFVLRINAFTLGGEAIALQAGTAYTLSFYCRAVVMPTLVTADIADALNGAVNAAYQTQLVLNQWVRVSLTSTVTANFNANFVDLIGNNTAAMTLEFFGVMINAGNTALPYAKTLALSRTIYLSEAVEFTSAPHHFIRFKRRNGEGTLRYRCEPGGAPNEVVLNQLPDFTPYTGLDEERTTFNFGAGESNDKLAIVRAIKPKGLHHVELSVVTEDDAVHTADTGNPLPSNNWNLITRVTAPIVTDLIVTLAGTSQTPMIAVSWQGSTGADSYQVDYSYDGGSSWASLPEVKTSNTQFTAQRGTLSVRVRANGLAVGAYVEYTGDPFSVPPANLQTFLVAMQPDGTRQFSMSMPGGVPPDFVGYKIRYRLGANVAWGWDDLTPMHDGYITQSPFESNQLAAGTYTFAAKAFDDSGYESESPLYIVADLADPRLSGVIFNTLPNVLGWPGTKTNCFVEPEQNILSANDSATFDTYGTFDANPRWVKTPISPIVYTDTTIDLAGVVLFTPFVSVVASGTVVVEQQNSLDNITYTAWALVGPTVSARYIRFRITVTGTNPRVTSMNIQLNGNAKTEQINDLNTSVLTGAYRIGVGDIRLPITKTYSQISQVQVTLQNVASGWSFTLIDKNTTTGPRIRIFNAAGSLADATIDAFIRGY